MIFPSLTIMIVLYVVATYPSAGAWGETQGCIFQKGKHVRVTTNIHSRKTLEKTKKWSADFKEKGFESYLRTGKVLAPHAFWARGVLAPSLCVNNSRTPFFQNSRTFLLVFLMFPLNKHWWWPPLVFFLENKSLLFSFTILSWFRLRQNCYTIYFFWVLWRGNYEIKLPHIFLIYWT